MNDIEYILLALLLLLIAVCMFSYTMNISVMNDEHMYVSAGVLAQSNTMYKDFAYLQMPYLPLIYAGIYKITGTEYYLLYARIFTFLTVFASVVVMYMLGYMVTNNFPLSLMGVLLYSFSEIIIHAMGYAWNAAPPIVFSLLGIYFFLKVSFGGGVKPLHVFFAGLFVAVAGGIKLYYLAMIAPFIISAFLFPASYSFLHKIKYSLAPLLGGFLTGLLPVLYYYINDPQLFLFNNLGFHTLNYEWHLENNFLTAAGTATVYSKLRFIVQVAGWQTIMPVIFAGVIGIILLFFNFKSVRDIFAQFITNKKPFVIGAVLIVTVMSALQPPSLWQHHLAYPFPFIILFIVSIYPALADHFKKIFMSVIAVAVLFVSVYGIPIASLHVQNLTSTDRWTPVGYHHEAQSITHHVPDNNKIATIEPLLVLEGGRMIYPEFSTGHFLFQIGDKLDPGQKERHRTTSMSSLTEWIGYKQPPSIVVPGNYRFYYVFDESIPHDSYYKIEDHTGKYSIYVRN